MLKQRKDYLLTVPFASPLQLTDESNGANSSWKKVRDLLQ